MKARRKWLTVSAIGLCVIAGIYVSAPRQPKYDGRKLEAWVADLASPNSRTQEVARAAIRAIGPAAVPFLTNSLAQRNARSLRINPRDGWPRRAWNWSRKFVAWEAPIFESRNAALALQALGPRGADAIPALAAALSDQSWTVAQAAALALGSMESAAVSALRERLRAAGTTELPWVLHAVRELGTNAAPLAVDLGAIMGNSRDRGVAGLASLALVRAGPEGAVVASKLLSSTNRAVKLSALSVLTQIGSPAILATNSLFELCKSDDAEIRLHARQALGATLAPRDVGYPIWLEGLRDPDVRNVEVSLAFLTMYPTNVRTFNREIAALAFHPTDSIREIASNALTVFRAWPQ